MSRLTRALLLLALGGAIAMLGFHRLALTDLIFGKGDAYHYFTPLWAARDAALRAGQLPLWTDMLFMGAPLLADSQLGTFYPPNWLTVGMPAWDALKASVLLHVAWAAAGAYLLARWVLGVGVVPAVVGSAAFALGGYIGAHAEQINQLQGIAWLPWAFVSFQFPVASFQKKRLDTQDTESAEHKAEAASGGVWAPRWRARVRGVRWRRVFPLALVLAMIALSGHTQTLFITGVGLGIFALVPKPVGDADAAHGVRSWRRVFSDLGPQFSALLTLALASVVAVVLAAVQILPTLELTGLSNRSSGFSTQAAMAFSWSPNLAARGLLPSLDGQVFGEYVAYLGVFGLALAVWGVFYGGPRRRPWLVLAAAGLLLAFGAYNPLNWLVFELPGFDLFRVPARWLALFALGGAMLAALGAQALLDRPAAKPQRGLLAVALLVIVLAVLAVWRSPYAAIEVDGSAAPTMPTLALWAAAALLFAVAVLVRGHVPRAALATLLAVVTLGELGIAATNMPHRDLVDRMAATDPRMTAYHIDAAEAIQPPDFRRVFSISLGYFDTYDHAGLLDRFARLGMTERAIKAGLTAAKLKEILAPNFPLLYGIQSVDGFGGGLLPTVYYSAFTSLLLPDGTPRTIDGRLRELLARPECFGACVPEYRWLDAMAVGYLVLDKTYDRFYDDVQFDLGLPDVLPADRDGWRMLHPPIVGDQIHVLATTDTLMLSVNDTPAELLDSRPVDDGLTLLRFGFEPTPVGNITYGGEAGAVIRAMTLVDSRTGAFSMLPPQWWDKSLSSDVKVYRRQFGGAWHLSTSRIAAVVPETWDGTEAALELMRDPAFDPTRSVVLHGAPESLVNRQTVFPEFREAREREGARDGTRMTFTLTNERDVPIAVVMADAWYPGWVAEIDGQPAPLYRANVMFRAVVVPPGTHTVVIDYQPPWLRPLLVFGGAAWLVFALAWLATVKLAASTGRRYREAA